jgi:hypothetical protein
VAGPGISQAACTVRCLTAEPTFPSLAAAPPEAFRRDYGALGTRGASAEGTSGFTPGARSGGWAGRLAAAGILTFRSEQQKSSSVGQSQSVESVPEQQNLTASMV